MTTQPKPFEMGQCLERQPGSGPLEYVDDLVPYGVPLLVMSCDDELTDLIPPKSHSVTVWTRELTEPGFRALPRVERSKDEFLEFMLETLREKVDEQPYGNLIDPQTGDRFRRTGRPISAVLPYFIYPEDGEIEVIVASTSMVYFKKVGETTEGRHSSMHRKYFTDAFVELVPREETSSEETA
jgi:hypothetical protein